MILSVSEALSESHSTVLPETFVHSHTETEHPRPRTAVCVHGGSAERRDLWKGSGNHHEYIVYFVSFYVLLSSHNELIRILYCTLHFNE